MPTIFDPVTLGTLLLPSRIIMSPLTRSRASEGRVPNDLMREYYTQRASAGLIFTEATCINPRSVGYADTPGIWSPEQVQGWRKITESVHGAGGRIVCQLWHVGRLSHPDFLNGQLPVAPSAIASPDEIRIPTGHAPYPTPHALTRDEIHAVIADYAQAARNAQEAGFDGVEIHGANGYLCDQFLRDGTNTRTDEYGGSIENRARFLLEATDAAVAVWGAERVGVHLSPRNVAQHGVEDSDPAAIFGYVASELGKRSVAYLFSRESLDGGPRFTPEMKRLFGGPVIANENFTPAQAQQVLDAGEADAVAWGQQFLANPDLPRRLARHLPLNAPNPATYYAQGATGYVDYPFADED